MGKLNRRKFMGTAAAAVGSAAAISALGTPAFAQDRRIRHGWWGNPERDKRTFGVIDIFNKAHPDIEVVGETLGFNDYFTRLTTQIAGGNMPDVIQQGYGVMQEYVDRGTLKPLEDYIGKTLDISDLDDSAISAGTFNGKLYGISIGANSMATIYNTRIYEEAGVEFDPINWTYDDVKRISVQITEATADDIYGTDDLTADWGGFGTYLTQTGVPYGYTEDGKDFSHDEQTIIDYWNIWKDIREAGGTPPGPESAGLAGVADLTVQGIVTGMTATTYAWSNQLIGVQELMQDKVGAAMRPHLAGGVPGQSIQPSQFVCLSRDTVDAEAATTYMSDFINDDAMTTVLGLERGIPAVSHIRTMLQPNLTETEQTGVAYFDAIQGNLAPLGPPPPAGNREIEEAFERLAVNVLLDRQSIEETAAQFIKEGRGILRRA